MAGNALINIKFAADLKGFSTSMQNANRSIQKMGKRLQNVGAALSVGVTAPLTAFAAVSLKNWDKQVKAIAQVEQGLLTTGNAVGYTSKQLQNMASELQNNSLFGDEDILQNATAQLLTFTNIAGEQFARTQQAALDLSTRLDGDLKSASIQLGKALNDPVANLSALSRSGIQFTESQKETINSLVATNKLAEAQTIILDELEKQYGGSAEAAAKAGLGGLKQLSNAFGDLQEEVGAVLAQAILPLVDRLKGMVSAFQSLSPETKKFIVILGGVAAAIGPLLALAGTILPAIATGFTVLTGPVGLVVAALTAIGVIIYKNWAPIKQTLVDIANYFIDLYNESTLFRTAVEGVVWHFKNLYTVGKFALTALWELLKGLGRSLEESFVGIGRILDAVLTGNLGKLAAAIQTAGKNTVTNFAQTAGGVAGSWQQMLGTIENNSAEAFKNINKKARIVPKIESPVVGGASSSNNVVTGASGGSGSKSRKSVTGAAGGLSTVGVADVFDFNLSDKIIEQGEKVKEGLSNIQQSFFDFSFEASQIVTNAATNILAGFGTLIGGLVSGSSGFSDFKNVLLGSLGGMLEQLGQIAIQVGLGLKAIKAAFKTLNPFVAIAAGVGLIALGKIVSSQVSNLGNNFAGGFTNGGVVGGNSFTGDRLFARVNSGEMILNRRQQNNLANMLTPASAAPVNVTLMPSVDISGDKLRILLNRVDKKNSRLGYEG